MQKDELNAKLTTMMSENRWKHTLGVEEVAVKLGERWGAEAAKCSIAALLHDCAKGMKVGEQIEYAKKMKIPLSKYDLDSKGVIHGRIGAVMADKEFGVKDREILRAIHFHPTGNARMGLLEKIVYLADYLDPGRELENAPQIMDKAMNNLDEACLWVVIEKCRYVFEKKECLHPDSVHFYNKMISEIKKENGV